MNSIQVHLGGVCFSLSLENKVLSVECPPGFIVTTSTSAVEESESPCGKKKRKDIGKQEEHPRKKRKTQSSEDFPSDILSALPPEILQHILCWLPLEELASTANLVCKYWRDLLSDESFWRAQFDMNFGCSSFLLMPWKMKCLYTLKQAKILAKGKPGEELAWATYNGYHRQFKKAVGPTWELRARKLFKLAATWGHRSIFEYLFSKCSYARNSRDNSGKTLLMSACKFGHADIVEILLSERNDYHHWSALDVDERNDYGKSALMYAAQNGHSKIVNMLLIIGNARPDIIDRDGETALSLAAADGHANIVSVLLPLYPPSELSRFNRCGHTPLTSACQGGHLAVVKLLLSQPTADVNIREPEGNTALIAAIESGHLEIVKLLLESTLVKIEETTADEEGKSDSSLTVDVNIRGVKGRTAFAYAVLNGHLPIAQYLLSKGADPDTADDSGESPLFYAIQQKHIDIALWLLSLEGINVNRLSSQGVAPLNVACRTRQKEIVQLLLAKGAHKEASENQREHPLVNACISGDLELVRLLMPPPPSPGSDFVWEFANPFSAICHSSDEHLDIAEYLISLLDTHPWLNECGTAFDNSGDPLSVATGRGFSRSALLFLSRAERCSEEERNEEETKRERVEESEVKPAYVKGVIGMGNRRIDLNAKKRAWGVPLLNLAARSVSIELTERFLELGADPSSVLAHERFLYSPSSTQAQLLLGLLHKAALDQKLNLNINN